MADQTEQQPLVGTIDAQPGAKVVVVNTLIGDIHTESPNNKKTQGYRNRLATIKRVRADWIEGFLHHSLENVARVELRLTPEQSSVAWGLRGIVQVPDRPPAEIPPGTHIAQIFDSFEQSILILGGPGTGKTTLLLELAEVLLDRAEQDDSQPIPIVFNLSSWAIKRKSLETWLVDEMNQRSDIPKPLGREWIKADAVIPLLDGLDEVDVAHRVACLDAINEFRSEHGLLPFAVCSRLDDYKDLGRKLRLRNAVVVKNLEEEDVEIALSHTSELSRLRTAVREDPYLAEMLRTPLMLWIATLAYRNAPERIDTEETPEATRSRLFGAYIEAMFSRRGVSVRYGRAQTFRWLIWLARAMTRRKLTIFTLEGLNPSFEPRTILRYITWIVTCIGVGLGYALICFVITIVGYGLSGLLIDALSHFKFFDIGPIDWGEQSDYMEMVGLIDARVLGPVGAIIATVIDLKPAETIDFSFRNLSKRLKPALTVAGIFLLLIVVTLTALDVVDNDSGWTLSALAKDFRSQFGGAAWYSMGSPIFMALLCGLIRLLLTERTLVRSKCNEGTLRSAKIATAATGVLIVLGIFIALRGGLLNWLLLASLVGGLAGGLFVLKHQVLRVIFWMTRLGPYRYGAFLEHANERVFLRKVGGGYVFTHRMLQEYFAGQIIP